MNALSTIPASRRPTSVLDGFFQLSERGTNVRTEVLAGITTFMTMAYIIFVNPNVLANAGLPRAGVATATALAAALMCLAMGLFTNYPFALASGLGLNAFLAFSVVGGLGVPWQTAMGVVFVEGLIITLLVLTRVRESVMNAIPTSLKQAIGGGIGFFIAFIGLRDAGIVVADPATFVRLGPIGEPTTLLSLFGLLATAVFVALRVRGGILWGILLTAAVGLVTGVASWPTSWESARLDFSTLFRLDIVGALQVGLWATIFAFLLTDFFDTMGTVISVGGQGGFLTQDGRLPRLNRVLLVDSLAAMIGGLFGVSSVTTYIESASGVSAGGRTGLTAVVTGICFLLTLFFIPLAQIVPAAATAPALVIVGFLMMSVVGEIDWQEASAAIPAFLTLLAIPLTFSISHGIGLGMVSYVLVKVLTGKAREVSPFLYVVAALFALYFALG
ncbi:MAG TPA: NCS2 family permease [Limnochordia bacterium]